MRKLISFSILMLTLALFFSQNSYGQITVSGSNGQDGTYTTFTTATTGVFAKLNGTSQAGKTITITITASVTTEPGTTALTGAAGMWTSMLIYPTVTGLTISGTVTGAPLINLSGANYVTINGSVGGNGSSPDLIISNLSTSSTAPTSTIQFINDASNNTIKYCSIKGASTSTGTGTINFSTGVTNGNDNNTIDHCNVCGVSSTTTPVNCINAVGSTTTAIYNDNCVISNCNIYDYYSTTLAVRGTNIGVGNSGWTVTGNSFYQTVSRTSFNAVVQFLAFTPTGNTVGFTVTNNYFGGTQAQCAGTPYTFTGGGTSGELRSVIFSTNNTAGLYNTFQGNVFKNINFASTYSSTNIECLLQTNNGNMIISNNLFGDSTGTSTITVSFGSSASFAAMCPGHGGTGIDTVKNNVVSGIAMTSGTSATGGCRGIQIGNTSGGSYATSTIIYGNLIGSKAGTGTITSNTNGAVYGIFYNVGTAATTIQSISNNTIANLNSTGGGSSSLIYGISCSSSTPDYSIKGNTIYNLTTNSTGTSNTANGIYLSNTLAGDTISGNTIYNLSCTAASAAVQVSGIYYSGPSSGNNVISTNKIYGFNLTSTSTTASLYGVRYVGGVSTISNNSISLGINNSGSSLTTGYLIYGINESAGPNNIYFNSVRVTGTAASGTTSSTYALYSTVATGIRNYKDNIFANDRTGGSTGIHYAVRAVTGGTLAIDYNNYYVAGAVLGNFGAADRADLAAWKSATGQDVNSVSQNPNFTSASNLQPSNYNLGTSISGITTDILGNNRNNPPSIGAYESTAACVTPTTQPTSLGFTATSSTVTGTFTASASTDHYLIVRNNTGTAPSAPSNGTIYTAGNQLTGSSFVAYQTGLSFTDAGLTANTHYYYYVYAANSNCIGGPLYDTIAPLTGNTTTNCGTPIAQPTILTLTPDTSSVSISFTPSATADHYLICRSTSGTFGSTLPINTFTFSYGSTLGIDTVISYQTGTTFTDPILHSNTQYYYFVFAANSICTGGPMYLTSLSPLSNYVVTLSNTPCVAPTNPPTNISFPTTGLNTINGSYTASVDADHYLILRNNTGIAPAVPTNGTLYTAGNAYDALGDTIIAYQIGLSFADSRLTTGTHYYYYIYAANSTCIGGPVYNTSSLSGSIYTNCVTPTTQPTVLNLTPTLTSIGGSYNPSPNADHYLIVRSTLSSTPTAPVNGMSYTPGTSTISSLDSVIAYQTNSTFNDTNLVSGTHYYYWVYAANSICSAGPLYLSVSPLTANTYTNCVLPANQSTNLILTPTTTSVSGTFTAATGTPGADHYLIVRNTTGITPTPLNGTLYSAENVIGTDTVVSYQTGLTFTDNGRANSTLYHYYIFSANSNCTGTTPLYLTTSPNTIQTTTLTPLSGTYSIKSWEATGGTNFNNFNDALNALNILGNSGPVTFNVTAGQSWSFTCTTSNPYGLKITTSGTTANPIVFQKDSIGPNPVLNITGSTATTDAGIWLNGVSYITFDGIDITDVGTAVEYGVYLYGTATNGCNYNTIKNCNITLSNSSNTSVNGIYLRSIATSTSGTNSHNKFYNNTINQAFYGVRFTGVTSYYDERNEIGTINGGHSVIKNIGYAAAYTSNAVNISYQDSLQIFNTLIDSVKSTSTTSGYLVGIQIAASCSNFHFYGDTIKDVIGAENYGFNIVGTTTGNNYIHNCVLRDFIETSGNTNLCRIGAVQSTLYFYNNQEFNINTTNTGAYGIEGFYTNSAGTYYIYNNNIYNFNCVGTAVVDGIAINTTVATTAYIYNNFISDLNNPAGTTTPAIDGIKIGNLLTAYVYYNTVYLKYTGSAATNTSACLFATATPTLLDLRNNIFINKCDMTSGARAAAFWWNSTTYTNIAATTNNNIYYAGTPGNKNLIFYNGTTAYQTLADYKAQVGTTKDSISFTEDVPFVNNSTKPYDLHINPLIATNVESNGQRITTPVAITIDNDGDLRWGETGYTGTGTATDIGADEYNHIYPCTTPVNAPTNLVLLPMVTTISGHFSPSPNTDHYLIVKNTTGITPSTPVNGTIYSSSIQLTGSTFVAYQSDTTFNDNSLTGNTQYYYFIYAANSVNCAYGPAYLFTSLLIGNTTTNCATPTAQPTDILLAPGSTTINGSFTATTSADHYLLIRSTSNILSATPLNGITYNANDLLGGGIVLGYQTGTSISDQGLLWNTTYYYYVFAANSICTGGPVYFTTLPLTGNTTTLPPPVTNKTLKITAMLQEYFNSTTGLMNQTLGINWDTGDLFKNFSGTTVDTVMVLIRKTNINADVVSSFPIDTVFYGVNLNNNGLITISLSAGITGYYYIEIKHRNSIETWSDSVNFSSDTVKYDFYNYVSQFAYDNGMLQDGAHAWIWGGDVNQNGNLESEDATIIYVAANSDDPTVNNGYVICDIDGNGNLDSQDYGLAYNNANIGANIINPFSYLKKK